MINILHQVFSCIIDLHSFWDSMLILPCVKVILHKTALPTHTDGAIRWHQCASYLVHPNQHLHLTDSAPCWVTLSILTTRHIRACPVMGWPSPAKIAPSCMLIWTPSNTSFLVYAQVHIPNGILIGSAVFCRAHDRDISTKRPRYSISNNRLHLCSTAGIYPISFSVWLM